MNNDILSINTNSLKNAIITCRNSIKKDISLKLTNDLGNSMIWQSSSMFKLRYAISSFHNTHYIALEKELEKYEEALLYIEKFQSLNSQNEEIKRQITNLNPYLYYEETREVTTYVFGKPKVIEKTYRVKDYGVENQINALLEKKYNNEVEMESQKTKITNLIY